jgi:hypothetical protein
MEGRVTFEEDGPDRTVLNIATDIPGLDDAKASHLSALIQRSADNIKRLAESDL